MLTPPFPVVPAKAETHSEPLVHTEIILAYVPTQLAVVTIGESAHDADIRVAKEKADHIREATKKVMPSPAKEYADGAIVIGKSNEQCVIYVRRVTGNQKVHGYAGYLVSEGDTPEVGAVALEKAYGHASVVVSVNEGTVTVHDANWVRGAITERTVPFSAIRGYIY